MHVSTSPYPHRAAARGGLVMILVGLVGAIVVEESPAPWTALASVLLGVLALTGAFVLGAALKAARSNGEVA